MKKTLLLKDVKAELKKKKIPYSNTGEGHTKVIVNSYRALFTQKKYGVLFRIREDVYKNGSAKFRSFQIEDKKQLDDLLFLVFDVWRVIL